MSDGDLISLEDGASILMRGKRRNNTRHLLDLYFLEWTEAAGTGLHMKRPTNAVPLAFLLILTISNRCELLLLDLLESFCSANITCVSVYLEQWFNL